jgi:transposase-like protein
MPGQDRLQPVIVMGMMCEGTVLTGIIADRKRVTLHAHIARHVRPGSTVITDDWVGYKGLDQLGFSHISVNHSQGFFNQQGFSTCEIDACWASLRRLMRCYRQVSAENLWLFLAEAECRYNFRHRREVLFDTLISHWPALTPEFLALLERRFDWRPQRIRASLG